MEYSSLIVNCDPATHIATVTLNRPEKRNALNAELISELTRAFAQISANDTMNVVVLAAHGKAFCAGMDLAYLQDIAQYSVMENKADSRRFCQMLYAIYTCPKPVIARVHGAAIAGGCGIASVCDVVVASKEQAVFGYSEVKIGFVPAIVSVYLTRRVGGLQAQRLLLSAENVSAEEAYRLGLITYLVEENVLDETVTQTAHLLAQNSSSAMALTKEILGNIGNMSLESALEYAVSVNAIARTTDDFEQGIAKFLNKS